MVKRWVERFGREATEQLLTANNERPYLTLKVNRLKVSIDEFQSLLASVNLKNISGKYLPEYTKLQNLTNITAWQYFKEGYFNIQDESTGFSCILLDPKPGMRVLDLCSAPGGKSAFIADLMNNKGEICAVDRYEVRLAIMKRNMTRLGITCINFVESDALEFNAEPFDRVLADVPCSGLGTLSKKPDIKWKKDLQDIRNINKLQYDLLTKAASLVKVGGVVVYSTCSIEPEENFNIVNKFLENNPGFKLEPATTVFPEELTDGNKCVQTLPHLHQMDGAFAAKLIRIN
jgi:16S rRNA (cytosine967-C5)-methyltransferase